MPLVQCPECQREVSTLAASCPQCAFPYPGRGEPVNGQAADALHPCADCGNPLSKHAKACPRCGSPGAAEQEAAVSRATPTEETWLCPHCQKPYTRRLKKDRSEYDDPVALSENGSDNVGSGDIDRLGDMPAPQARSRRKSPLWAKEAQAIREERPQFPRSSGRRGWMVFAGVVVVAAALAGLAYWQFDGLNPLEALVYWRF